jgi:uroporphyrinogen-III decarboxylase
MVAQLNADYAAGRNQRVPITMTWDEALWLHLAGRSFREFYTDPRTQLEVTLAGMAWCAENIVHDAHLGPPEGAWTVVPRWWMDEPECLGCQVVIQEHDFAWSQPLDLPKDDLLARVRSLDPEDTVRRSRLFRLYQDMTELTADMRFQDRPVRIVAPTGTHGIFTIAARVRGEQRLCLDLYDDPDFAHAFLDAIAEHTIGHLRAWHTVAATGWAIPNPHGWGMPDDSLQMISPETYRRFVLPRHQQVFSALTTGGRSMHLCGYAQQHFEALYHELGIRALEGPGPFVDAGDLLARLPGLHLGAQTDHTLLITGPPTAIEEMMRGMLAPAAKRPGRYRISAFVVPSTPLAHVLLAYEAGIRYGCIGDRP